MVHQQLEELRMKELVAYMEDGRKVVRHVLADDKTGLLKQGRPTLSKSLDSPLRSEQLCVPPN